MEKRKFIVTVNGTSYGVEVEVIEEKIISQDMEISSSQASKSIPSVEFLPTKIAKIITAPFPAKVLSIKIKKGNSVKTGGVLLTLEAMKMETEISAPQDGIVKEIFVREGEMVETGNKLLTIE